MGYWKEFNDEFLKLSKKNLEKLQQAGEHLMEKAQQGGRTLIDKTQEEIEILKKKNELTKARTELANALTEVGDTYLDYYKNNKQVTLTEELQKKLVNAMAIEKSCLGLENTLRLMKVDPNPKTKEAPISSTPY